MWAERIAPFILVCYFLLGGAYRALLIFGVMLLAGRIAPVISVVVFYWVERIPHTYTSVSLILVYLSLSKIYFYRVSVS